MGIRSFRSVHSSPVVRANSRRALESPSPLPPPLPPSPPPPPPPPQPKTSFFFTLHWSASTIRFPKFRRGPFAEAIKREWLVRQSRKKRNKSKASLEKFEFELPSVLTLTNEHNGYPTTPSRLCELRGNRSTTKKKKRAYQNSQVTHP